MRGYGGNCLPKDTTALYFLAKEYEYELKSVKAAIEINELQKLILVNKVKEKFSTLKGLNIVVLGVTYKPETDCISNSPAIDNIKSLLKEGAKVTVYDPAGIENCKQLLKSKVEYANNVEEALRNKDLCFIFTEWTEFKNLSKDTFKKYMKKPIIYDARGIYNSESMKDIGYYFVGK